MLFNRIYIVDWKKLVKDLLILKLKRPKQIAWLFGLIKPVNQFYTTFLYYRKYVLYRLSITTQVFSLENLLNDRFDPIDRRIKIKKPVDQAPLPLFLKSENKPVKLFTKAEGIHQVLYTKAETSIFSVDFIVEVPVFVQFDMNELTELLNLYVLQSKSYKVKIV